jgi:hypothetical protein
MSGRWVDLREAAELLSTSTEAVRKRAARGSLHSDRQNGRVLVWVDEGRTEGGREAQVDREALLEAKGHTIRVLEEQLRLRAEEIQRRDVIISQLTQANAALAQRVPELEAPVAPEPPGAPERPAEGTVEPTPSQEPVRDAQEAAQPRSWWRRVFGG